MKTPTPWSRWHDEVHMVTNGPANTVFQGFKVEMNKTITPNFLLSHKVTLGSSPGGRRACAFGVVWCVGDGCGAVRGGVQLCRTCSV